MSEEKESAVVESDPCPAKKHGQVDLVCGLPAGHDGRHEATFRRTETIDYPGAEHHATHSEHVRWDDDPGDYWVSSLSRVREQLTEARADAQRNADLAAENIRLRGLVRGFTAEATQ